MYDEVLPNYAKIMCVWTSNELSNNLCKRTKIVTSECFSENRRRVIEERLCLN